MKRTLLLAGCLLAALPFLAQNVKTKEADSLAAYRANDRLKNAGPKDGWKDSSRQDSREIKNNAPAASDSTALKKKKKKGKRPAGG